MFGHPELVFLQGHTPFACLDTWSAWCCLWKQALPSQTTGRQLVFSFWPFSVPMSLPLWRSARMRQASPLNNPPCLCWLTKSPFPSSPSLHHSAPCRRYARSHRLRSALPEALHTTPDSAHLGEPSVSPGLWPFQDVQLRYFAPRCLSLAGRETNIIPRSHRSGLKGLL